VDVEEHQANESVARRPFWTRLPARRLQFTLDVSVLAVAFVVAYLLRFDFVLPPDARAALLRQLPVVVLLEFAALSWSGVYALLWRYVGLADIRNFGVAAVITAVPLIVARLCLPGSLADWRVPLSVILIDAMLAFGAVLGIRLLRRVLYERYEKTHAPVALDGQRKATLLIGAGGAGFLAVREILRKHHRSIDVRGFVDDDVEKRASTIHGIKVLGATRDLPRLVNDYGVEQVIITIPSATRQELDRIVRICESIPVKARIIPNLSDVIGGKLEMSRIRDVQIEDLLGREQVQLDVEELARFIAGKVVMVTGAGGSIGSELCRQVVRFKPSKLLLVERAEPSLFNIDREMQVVSGSTEILPLLGDVGDEGRMRGIFHEHRPQLVFHAAAHKHVALMERNPVETFKNNVFATRLVGSLAAEHGVEAFVLISTDKAVRPASIMGASKRIAELVVQDLARKHTTRFLAVRFGNVLGSTGSVIPIFRDQIQHGGPITITHPEMIRYFMTIPEAAQLVLQAGAMGKGGEIFVLDMGAPVRIVDLAMRMITLSGLRPFEDIDVVFTGPRPGEKLFEELETDEEHITKTRHPKIFIGRITPTPPSVIARALEDLSGMCLTNDTRALRVRVAGLLPEAQLGGLPTLVPNGRPQSVAPKTRDLPASGATAPVSG
jgi:FlaA1/EpsC-like NDP-sugar epimerase